MNRSTLLCIIASLMLLTVSGCSSTDKRITKIEERQHQQEIRITDNRITDSNRVSDLGK